MLDSLRSAGTESPSGRLVIDLNTLRQVQAAVAAAPAVSEETRPLATGPNHPVISRVNVAVERAPARKSNLWLVGVVLLIAVLGSGVLAARWWKGQDPALITQSTPTPTPTPTATPTPTPTPSKSPAHKREEPRRADKPSTVKKVWNKLKKALPF